MSKAMSKLDKFGADARPFTFDFSQPNRNSRRGMEESTIVLQERRQCDGALFG
jgi:hypothetical protein